MTLNLKVMLKCSECKKNPKTNPVDYNCRELLKHDSGAGERKLKRFKG